MIRPEDDLGSILDLQASSFHLPEMRNNKNCSAWAKLNTKKGLHTTTNQIAWQNVSLKGLVQVSSP